MTLVYTPFDDSYKPSYRQVSRVVRAGEMLFTCGQLDTDGNGVVQHPGDLHAQTIRSMRLLCEALEQAGSDARDLLHLHVFYRADTHFDEAEFDALVQAQLPHDCCPVTIYQRLDSFPKVVEVEVDGIARTGTSPTQRYKQGPAQVIRRDDFLVGRVDLERDSDVQMALDALDASLEEIGASRADVCKVRYLDGGLSMDPDGLETLFANALSLTPTVYTRLPLHQSPYTRRLEVYGACSRQVATDYYAACSLPSNLWSLGYVDWVKRGNWLFVGGQLAPETASTHHFPDAIAEQVNQVMNDTVAQLAQSDIGFAQVAKVNAYYRGKQDYDDWVRNVQLRCDFYPQPGPASTGVEVPHVGHQNAALVLDCIAYVPGVA